jgi:nitroreductase
VTDTPASLIDSILERRSARSLAEPAPTTEELDTILRARATVPDYGALRPFRFVVVSGAARARFGAALGAARPADAQKAFFAPTLVALIASPRAHRKIQDWEQLVSAACTGYALVLAAHALGVGAVWKSVPFTRGEELVELLDLGRSEQLLGWVNLGRAVSVGERRSIDLAELVSVLDVDGGTARYRA